MKTIIESLQWFLNEAAFQAGDYTKHDFKYAKGVINDLLNSPTILLGNNGETEHQLDPADQEEFKAEYDSNNFPKTAKEFDAMTSKYSSFPRWNTIFKGKYSGKVTNTKGQRAEGLVCYMFNEANADVEAFNQKLAELCETHQIKYLDAYTNFSSLDLSKIYMDAVHLNKEGQSELARVYNK